MTVDRAHLVVAACAYHMTRMVEAMGRTRVMRAMGLQRSEVEAVERMELVLSARLRDRLDRLYVEVMLLDDASRDETEGICDEST